MAMRTAFLDASALAKRFVPEVGTERMDTLFRLLPRREITCLTLAVGEVLSVICRRRNRGLISPDSAMDAAAWVVTDILDNPAHPKVEMTDALVTPSFPLIDRHAINSTDAVLLHAALAAREAGDTPIVICSDARLIRAARAEGLLAFDPETQTEQELETTLAQAAPPPGDAP